MWEGVLASQVGVGERGPTMMFMMAASDLVFKMFTASIHFINDMIVRMYKQVEMDSFSLEIRSLCLDYCWLVV